MQQLQPMSKWQGSEELRAAAHAINYIAGNMKNKNEASVISKMLIVSKLNNLTSQNLFHSIVLLTLKKYSRRFLYSIIIVKRTAFFASSVTLTIACLDKCRQIIFSSSANSKSNLFINGFCLSLSTVYSAGTSSCFLFAVRKRLALCCSGNRQVVVYLVFFLFYSWWEHYVFISRSVDYSLTAFSQNSFRFQVSTMLE